MQRLGEKGLEKLAMDLSKATGLNDVYAPVDLLTSVTIPAVDSIQFHPVATLRSGDKHPAAHLAHLKSSVDAVPFFCQVGGWPPA